MGWVLTTAGVLVGDAAGISVRSFEERGRVTVIELVAPGVLPRMEMVSANGHVALASDGMRDVHLDDPQFAGVFVIRAAEPWFARVVIDATVRRALLAAPVQSWITKGDRLIGRSSARIEPLDLFARATALCTVIAAVPWDAYPDRDTPPTLEAFQRVVSERRSHAVERLPSMPGHA